VIAKNSISPDVDEVAYESVGGQRGQNAEIREVSLVPNFFSGRDWGGFKGKEDKELRFRI
jgi:hypothetical protein